MRQDMDVDTFMFVCCFPPSLPPLGSHIEHSRSSNSATRSSSSVPEEVCASKTVICCRGRFYFISFYFLFNLSPTLACKHFSRFPRGVCFSAWKMYARYSRRGNAIISEFPRYTARYDILIKCQRYSVKRCISRA